MPSSPNEPDRPELPPPIMRDPRLEIPAILQQPVKRPEYLKPPAPKAVSSMGELGKALAIGLDFLFTIGAAGLLGWLLDRWQGWSPYGLLIGLLIGFIAATARIIQRTSSDDRHRNRPKRG